MYRTLGNFCVKNFCALRTFNLHLIAYYVHGKYFVCLIFVVLDKHGNFFNNGNYPNYDMHMCACVKFGTLNVQIFFQDPRNVELIWDQMFRATLNYGRKGLPVYARHSPSLSCLFPISIPFYLCCSLFAFIFCESMCRSGLVVLDSFAGLVDSGKLSARWTWLSGISWES